MKVNYKHPEVSIRMNNQTKIYRAIWYLVFFGSIVYVFLSNTTASFGDLIKWLSFWIGTGSILGGILGILTKQITLKGFTYHGDKAIRFGFFYIIVGIIICLISMVVKIK
jgi:hypothetical protein